MINYDVYVYIMWIFIYGFKVIDDGCMILFGRVLIIYLVYFKLWWCFLFLIIFFVVIMYVIVVIILDEVRIKLIWINRGEGILVIRW